MDQSPMQEVDILDGLESTLTMLGHKLKNVTLVRAYDRSLPRIMVYLDAIFHNVYVRNPDMLRGWMSASHLERAPQHAATPTPTPTPTPATATGSK